ncbi:MAG: lamin tail domain-containing protein, partial [Bacteroidales bacterium]|nr:lamin tail domain-containing protein [Bacteroidales bacterium]
MSEQAFTFIYQRIKLTEVKLLNREIIHLSFTKEVFIEAFDTMSLTLDNSIIKPQNITTDDNQSFSLHLPHKLENGKEYNLAIRGLVDAINDPVSDVNTTIMHYDAQRFDVVFNEWMADPTPSMGLPELEFIELYNNSSYNINLSEWILQVNDRYVTLPDSVIEANGFLCLVSSNHMDNWNKSIPSAFVKSMPALLNSGFEMIIFNNKSNVIDAFHYQTALIPGEGFKKDGGWSTERIDP